MQRNPTNSQNPNCVVGCHPLDLHGPLNDLAWKDAGLLGSSQPLRNHHSRVSTHALYKPMKETERSEYRLCLKSAIFSRIGKSRQLISREVKTLNSQRPFTELDAAQQ